MGQGQIIAQFFILKQKSLTYLLITKDIIHQMIFQENGQKTNHSATFSEIVNDENKNYM